MLETILYCVRPILGSGFDDKNIFWIGISNRRSRALIKEPKLISNTDATWKSIVIDRVEVDSMSHNVKKNNCIIIHVGYDSNDINPNKRFDYKLFSG